MTDRRYWHEIYINLYEQVISLRRILRNIPYMGSQYFILIRGEDCAVMVSNDYFRIFSRGYRLINSVQYAIVYHPKRWTNYTKNCARYHFTDQFWRDLPPIMDNSVISNVISGLEELLELSKCEFELIEGSLERIFPGVIGESYTFAHTPMTAIPPDKLIQQRDVEDQTYYN